MYHTFIWDCVIIPITKDSAIYIVHNSWTGYSPGHDIYDIYVPK